jgi:putative PIN family toxin of toxin-antitoxin system
MWQTQRVRPLASRETAQELLRVIAYPKFRLTAAEQEELLADYLPYCETVSVPRQVPGLPACRDVHDRAFLRLAAAGRADVLVTGDADLLVLKSRCAIPILTPRELRDRLGLQEE